MIYEIYSKDVCINTIVSDEDFVKKYCNNAGYTYKETITQEKNDYAQPTFEEQLADLQNQILTMRLGGY